jgi:succinoglycan biosynthesis protein ExoO
MLKHPLFSVIIPVYNKESTIRRSVMSVLTQTFLDFEIIIVCDPSTDNSNKVVSEFIDNPKVRIYRRSNRGPGGYASRNLGIKKSKSNWIGFLDADDEWFPEHLERILMVIEKFNDAKFISSSWFEETNKYRYADPFTKKTNYKKVTFINFKEYLKSSIKGERPNNTNSIIFNKLVLDNKDFFPEGKTSRSGDLYAWVLNINKVGGIYWSPHVGSITYRDSPNMTSKTEVPSILLNIQMVDQISLTASKTEITFAKVYANRLIKRAFFEHKKFKQDPKVYLFNSFYWSNDIIFCFAWSLISITPDKFINLLRKVKKLFFEKRK